jgi:hypothetical protein
VLYQIELRSHEVESTRVELASSAVVPAGIEPARTGLQPVALPTELKNHGREPRGRTGFILLPKQAG